MTQQVIKMLSPPYSSLSPFPLYTGTISTYLTTDHYNPSQSVGEGEGGGGGGGGEQQN